MSTGAVIIGAILLLLGLATVIGVLCFLGKDGKIEPHVPNSGDNYMGRNIYGDSFPDRE